ncbi:MAG: YhbY family RNA-binding protein [Gemmatimonadota bacterium]
MKGRERAELRSEAHHLAPAIHIGAAGVSPSVLVAISDALRSRELIKIAVGRDQGLEPRAVAAELARELGAEVIQVIGRKVTLYRRNPDLETAADQPPPWRRPDSK